MRELGMVLFGCTLLALFFATVIYPELEYTGYSRNSNCSGECYEEYVKKYGNVVEQLKAKQALAMGDEFSSIRSLWTGCAACHGANGGGGVGPMLAGGNAKYMIEALTEYRAGETRMAQSALMWGQAAQLTDKEIELIGKFIEDGFPD